MDTEISNLGLFYFSIIVCGPLLLGAIYTLNFYSDIKVDRISTIKKDVIMSKQPFATGKVKPLEGILFAGVLIGLGLMASWIINFCVFLLAVVGVIIGIIYSFPPRLKDLPFGDIIANSVSAGFICYAMGWCTLKGFSEVPILRAAWFMCLIASTYLLTVIIDFDSDKKAGLRTTTTFLGVEKSIKLSFSIYIASLIFYILILLNSPPFHYFLLIPFLIKSSHGYCKVYRDPSLEKVYRLGEKAVKACVVVLLLLMILYPFLSLLGRRV